MGRSMDGNDQETGSTRQSRSPEEDAERAQAAKADGEKGIVKAQNEWLERAIQNEIVPRLMLAHRNDHPAMRTSDDSEAPPLIGQPAIDSFTALVLEGDQVAVKTFTDKLLSHGVPHESVLLDLLAPTARRLGDMWTQDLCDFTTVTIALGQLHTLLRQMGRDQPNSTVDLSTRKRILLMPLAGEQHNFGVLMVGEFFRRAGWGVWGDPPLPHDDMLDLIREESFPIVGLSVSADRQLDKLISTINAIREAALNEDLKIMVGGQIFVRQPELSEQIGADITAINGPQAVLEAERLVGAPGHDA
ncbi:MAG: cobalamin B12-binding domain-containing protein [Pseudomonadota bacterium]